MSLRERKIQYLQTQQKNKKGLPIRRLQVKRGVVQVKRVTNRNLMANPKKVEEIMGGYKKALRKEKIERLRDKIRVSKNPPSKLIPKRMFS